MRLLVPNVTWFAQGILRFNLYLSWTTQLHMSFLNHSGEKLELPFVNFQFYLVFLCEKIYTRGQKLKFEYIELLTKTSLSLRPKNDFSRVEPFS